MDDLARREATRNDDEATREANLARLEATRQNDWARFEAARKEDLARLELTRNEDQASLDATRKADHDAVIARFERLEKSQLFCRDGASTSWKISPVARAPGPRCVFLHEVALAAEACHGKQLQILPVA